MKYYEALWLILGEHTVVRFLNPMEQTLLSVTKLFAHPNKLKTINIKHVGSHKLAN